MNGYRNIPLNITVRIRAVIQRNQHWLSLLLGRPRGFDSKRQVVETTEVERTGMTFKRRQKISE